MITRPFNLFLLILTSCCTMAFGQMNNCTLGIGGKDTEVITQVFQLNDQQINQMEIWIGELQVRNKLIEDQIKELFDNHPQSTQEELLVMSQKYNVLKDQLLALSLKYDRKVLGLFNEKQYQRYVELCAEALRKPLTPITEDKEQKTPD